MTTELHTQSIPRESRNKDTTPKVSIGMPVYNGELYIREALDSLLEQSFTDFELIISDNASTDGTQVICTEYAQKDSRIRYVRQPSNKGATANFKFVLDESIGEYFMWAAADDTWSPTFVEKNLNVLINNHEIICSVSRVSFVHEGKFLRQSTGTESITGPPGNRLRTYLKSASDNSRFYGLYRRHVALDSLSAENNFHAADWFYTIITLTYGSHHCIDEILMFRRAAEPDRYMKAIHKDNLKYFWLGIPLLPLSIQLARTLNIKLFLHIIPILIITNLAHLKKYIAFQKRTFIKNICL